MTNYNDGKWHGWNGGECPVHPQSVGDITYFDGVTYKDCKLAQFDRELPLLFRVIKEYREPREFTLYVDDMGNAVTWYSGDLRSDLPHCQVIKVREVLE